MHQIHGGGECDHSKETSLWQKILAILVAVVLIIGFWMQALPKSYFDKDFIVGEVTEDFGMDLNENDLFAENVQLLKVELKNGQLVEAESVQIGEVNEQALINVGDKVVVNRIANISEGTPYQIVDVYRLNSLLFLFGLLVIVAFVLSGWVAIYSFIGLAFSVLVLMYVIVNGILAGYDPLLVTIIGSLLISTVSVYLGHGLNKKTTIAVVGIVSTLVFVGILSIIFVKLASLFGRGSEEAFFLQMDVGSSINLQGIFLAGIIIGTLGVLDDITTSQVAVVDQLRKANPNLSSIELYKRAISVGKEHISALINTLVLAYAGASMPLFILFVQDSIQPVWGLLNGEFIAEEIARTLLGSIALILSVPVTTLLAAKLLGKKDK